MVFFRLLRSGRTVLHVGDFRWNREAMVPQLRRLLGATPHESLPRLDWLYLDTTYCDPKYRLPAQATVIGETHDMIKALLEEGRLRAPRQRTLLLFGSYSIGKERVYMEIAARLGAKVYVDPERHRTLSCLGWSQETAARLTMDPGSSNLWVVPLGHIKFAKLDE